MDKPATPAISESTHHPRLSSEPTSLAGDQQAPKSSLKGGKPYPQSKKSSWLTSKAQKLAGWLATSEPSAQALKQHRKEAFKTAGISQKEAEPHAKLHAPIGEIPPDAIHPSMGPSPEELAQTKAAERRKRSERSRGLNGKSGATTTPSSESWSIYSGQTGSVSGSMNTFPYTGSSS